MAKKAFQDLSVVSTNESLDDYELVVTKEGTDKRLPHTRLKSESSAVESGLHNDTTTKKPRLGGTLLEDVSIDGDGTKQFEVVNAKDITLATSGLSAKSTLTLGTALSIPTRIKTESLANPTTFAELVIDADNNTEIGQKTATATSGMKMSNASQILMYNDGYQLGVKEDGVYITPLPAVSTETEIVFIDANGKLAKGVVPTNNNSSFAVAYEKQIPFTNAQSIAQASLETAFRATVSNAILDGYYIAVFRCNQIDPLSKSATVNYQISGQSAATLTAKHGMSVLFKYVNDVLTDIEALTDSAVVDAITVLQNNPSSETANELIDTDTIHFLTGAGNLPLNRQLQPHVQIPALIDQSTGPDYLGNIVPMSQAYISSVGQIRVPLLNFENSQTVEFEQTTNPTTKERVVKAHVVGDNTSAYTGSETINITENEISVIVAALISSIKENQIGLDENGKLVVFGGEQDYPIIANSPSFAVNSRLVYGDAMIANDIIANYDNASKTLGFENTTIGTTDKFPRLKTVEISVSVSGVLDANGDLKVRFERDFMLPTGEEATTSNDEHLASFPRPRVLDTSATAVSESTPYLWTSDANIPVTTWSDATHVYYKFIGLNQFDRVQLYISF